MLSKKKLPILFQEYCAEYNTVGERIQPHYSLKCSDVMPPCGKRYISTDAYMCKLQVKTPDYRISF